MQRRIWLGLFASSDSTVNLTVVDFAFLGTPVRDHGDAGSGKAVQLGVLLHGDRLMAVLITIPWSPWQQQPVSAGGRKWSLPHLLPLDDGDATHQLQILALE